MDCFDQIVFQLGIFRIDEYYQYPERYIASIYNDKYKVCLHIFALLLINSLKYFFLFLIVGLQQVTKISF